MPFSFGGRWGDKANDIAALPDGSLLLAGSFEDTVDFDPGPGVLERSAGPITYFNPFLVRYDRSGRPVFVKTFDWGNGRTAVDAQGRAVWAGSFLRTVDFDPDNEVEGDTRTTLGSDAFVARYDETGRLMSLVTYGIVDYMTLTDVVVLPNDDAVVTGTFQNTVDFDPAYDDGTEDAWRGSNGGFDAYIARYDPAGRLRSVTTLGGAKDDGGARLAVDPDGSLVVAGSFASASIDLDPAHAGANDVLVSAGANANNGFLARYAPDGRLAFALRFGPALSLNHVAAAPDGGALMAGHFTGTEDFDPGPGEVLRTSNIYEDAFVARYDAAGALVFVQTFGGSSQDAVTSVSVAPSGEAVVTGYFLYGPVDFDFGADTPGDTRTSQGGYDLFIARYAPSGRLVALKTVGGPKSEMALGMALEGSGSVVVTGTFTGANVNFAPDQNLPAAVLSSQGSSDVFVVRYAPDGTAVDATPEVSVLPAASDVSITALGGRRVRVSSPQAAMLDVYDLLGRAVRRHPVSAGRTDVDLSDLRPGAYALRAGTASTIVLLR